MVFGSSLFVTIAIITIKAIELKREKENILLRLVRKFDSQADKLISFLKFKTLQIIQSIRYIILVQIKAICKNLLERVEKRIIDEYKTKQNTLMGHKNITNKGSVSFYLKKITEERSNGKKGKIED